MSGPAFSGCSSAPSGSLQFTELFNNLVSQLKECHDTSTQDLQNKVAKLKKERYLDAKKLEEFIIRNQQMKEKQRSLLDTVAALEEKVRDRAGPCDRCAVTEEQIKKMQADGEKFRQQHLRLIADLMTERNSLQDDNRKLSMELAILKESSVKENYPSEQSLSSSDPEEGMIPDSPVQQISLSGNNRLKLKKKNNRYVRYAEKSLLPSPCLADINQSTREPAMTSESRGIRVLVPNTCEVMDPVQHPREGVGLVALDGEEGMVAETCGLELDTRLVNTHTTTAVSRGPKISPPHGQKNQGTLKPTLLHSSSSSAAKHNLNASENGSPSLLRTVTLGLSGTAGSGHEECRGQDEESSNKTVQNKEALRVTGGRMEPLGQPAKRKKVSKSEEEEEEERPGCRKRPQGIGGSFQIHQDKEKRGDQRPQDGVFKCPLLNRKPSANTQHMKKSTCCEENKEVMRELHFSKKSNFLEEDLAVEPAWSLDPVAALSQYERDTPYVEEHEVDEDEEEQEGPGHVRRGAAEEPGTVDMDCTYVSHSLLLQNGNGRGPDQVDSVRRRSSVSGLGHKAQDSLAEMFDKTGYGEYESCPQTSDFYLEHKGHTCHEEEEEEEEEEKADGEQEDGKKREFAHVAVVRKREERKKLQGHTCKECETFYSHLPDAERQRKLSACSRHRFRYIPPSTPEHFWEVGFPSTQTCVERGYIREEEKEEPENRSRRRRPYNATFSPKAKK